MELPWEAFPWAVPGSNLQVSLSSWVLPVKKVCWQQVAACAFAGDGSLFREVEASFEARMEGVMCDEGLKRGSGEDCVCIRVLMTSNGVISNEVTMAPEQAAIAFCLRFAGLRVALTVALDASGSNVLLLLLLLLPSALRPSSSSSASCQTRLPERVVIVVEEAWVAVGNGAG